MAEAKSPTGLPATATTYEPTSTLATTNAAASVPPEIEQLDVPIAIPDSWQIVSPDEKPEPVTSTVDPARAEIGWRAIDGGNTTELVV